MGELGGTRPGAGRPKGAKGKRTLDKEAKRELVARMVAKELRPMLEAQISNAKGIRYVVVRQKSTGKFLRRLGATGETHDPDTESIEVWEKDPNVQAFDRCSIERSGSPLNRSKCRFPARYR